jgi:uncharacterized membrane protein
VTPPLFQWSVPLVAGGLCMLVAPLWMFGTPAADEGFTSSRQLALYVVLYYPSAVAMLFIVSRLHRLVTRKADRPRLELRYLTGANICLAIAALVLIGALIVAFRS